MNGIWECALYAVGKRDQGVNISRHLQRVIGVPIRQLANLHLLHQLSFLNQFGSLRWHPERSEGSLLCSK